MKRVEYVPAVLRALDDPAALAAAAAAGGLTARGLRALARAQLRLLDKLGGYVVLREAMARLGRRR